MRACSAPVTTSDDCWAGGKVLEPLHEVAARLSAAWPQVVQHKPSGWRMGASERDCARQARQVLLAKRHEAWRVPRRKRRGMA